MLAGFPYWKKPPCKQIWKKHLMFCDVIKYQSMPRTLHLYKSKKKRKQEVGGDLSVCVMNILPKTSNLPSLLAINLTKGRANLQENTHVEVWFQ